MPSINDVGSMKQQYANADGLQIRMRRNIPSTSSPLATGFRSITRFGPA